MAHLAIHTQRSHDTDDDKDAHVDDGRVVLCLPHCIFTRMNIHVHVLANVCCEDENANILLLVDDFHNN